jgi:hypothetical protein
MQYPTTRIPDTTTSAFTMSAHIAVVSVRSPTHEVRSIQDHDDYFHVFLESIGEADHHRIGCLRCCASHGAGYSDCLHLFEGR